MISRMMAVPAAVLGVVLVVAALWAWQQAPHLAFDADRPQLVAWSIRSGAIAAAALAQIIFLMFVVGAIYRVRRMDLWLRACSIGLFALASAGAAGLGLASR